MQRFVLTKLYINEIEEHKQPDKVLHAEPLYIDLSSCSLATKRDCQTATARQYYG